MKMKIYKIKQVYLVGSTFAVFEHGIQALYLLGQSLQRTVQRVFWLFQLKFFCGVIDEVMINTWKIGCQKLRIQININIQPHPFKKVSHNTGPPGSSRVGCCISTNFLYMQLC